jgi:hypothetical protein
MLVETTIITLALYLSGCSNLNTKGKLIQAKSTSCKPEGPIGEALEEAIKKFKKSRADKDISEHASISHSWWVSVHTNEKLYKAREKLEKENEIKFYDSLALKDPNRIPSNFNVSTSTKVIPIIQVKFAENTFLNNYCENNKSTDGLSFQTNFHSWGDEIVIQKYIGKATLKLYSIWDKKKYTENGVTYPLHILYVNDKKYIGKRNGLRDAEKEGKIFYKIRLDNKKYSGDNEFFVWQFINIKNTEERYEILYKNDPTFNIN